MLDLLNAVTTRELINSPNLGETDALVAKGRVGKGTDIALPPPKLKPEDRLFHARESMTSLPLSVGGKLPEELMEGLWYRG